MAKFLNYLDTLVTGFCKGCGIVFGLYITFRIIQTFGGLNL